MRRWFAWALLLLTALLPLQPLFASTQADAGLPACCRRNGAHHCALLRAIADNGTHPVAYSSPCPLFKISAIPALVAAARSCSTLVSQAATSEDVSVFEPLVSFVSLARSRSVRAPPTTLLFTSGFAA